MIRTSRAHLNVEAHTHQGMTGNYAIGLGAVDYFFSSTATTYTFTWGHGNWVYTVSSASFAELEAILNNLPF